MPELKRNVYVDGRWQGPDYDDDGNLLPAGGQRDEPATLDAKVKVTGADGQERDADVNPAVFEDDPYQGDQTADYQAVREARTARTTSGDDGGKPSRLSAKPSTSGRR